MKERKYFEYISGLKGIACFLVMAGHFFAIAKYAEYAGMRYPSFMKFVNSPLGIILDEAFWLYLFFVISGFLISQAKIETLKELIVKCIKRVLRLAIPILFAGFFIYIIQLIIGVHNNVSSVFHNSWFQSFYVNTIEIQDVILSPYHVLVKEVNDINAPYWVLHDMLAASLIIYVFLYLHTKVQKATVMKHILNFISVCICYKISEIMFACVIGMIITQYHENITKLLERIYRVLPIFLILSLSIYFIYPGYIAKSILFAILILTVPYFKTVESVLSKGVCKFLGENSFGIYSLHWVIICSAGAWIMVQNYFIDYFWKGFAIAFICSTGLTILISFVFTSTAEKWAGQAINKLTEGISKALGKIPCINKI